MGTCDFCGRQVLITDTAAYKQVTVWVGGPKKNSSKLSVDTGRVAHDECIVKALHGIAPDQEEMDI